jgi:hypothetical protein
MYSLSSHLKISYDPPWTNNIKPKLQLSMYKILQMWGWEIEHACSTIEKIEKNMHEMITVHHGGKNPQKCFNPLFLSTKSPY